MWIHCIIFLILLFVWLGEKAGWLPDELFHDKEARTLFFLLGLAGNLLGMALSLKSADLSLPENYRLRRTEDYYEENFMVSIDQTEESPFTVQVPEWESEEEKNPQEALSEEEKRRQEIREILEQYNEEKQDPDYYYLPDEWNGKTFTWSRPRDNTGALLASLILVAAAASLVLKSREKQTLVQKRQEELLIDYPDLIMKFTLLIAAGMTVRNAFAKIASDYRKKRSHKARAAYEAIETACHEMESGVSEAEAYYRFGERCGQIRYKTFATLLLQNLQKGSRQLVAMLEKESAEAWDERKRKARIAGETASTKLLFPMVLMLLVVMAIIMIPAMMSFYGT